jgi:hypothetical protein
VRTELDEMQATSTNAFYVQQQGRNKVETKNRKDRQTEIKK